MQPRDVMTLGNVADLLREASAEERVSVGDIVTAVGKQGLHPLLLVPALLAATPLSGIPGVSAVCGLLIALISVQLLISAETVRLPKVLTRRSVDSAMMHKALDNSGPVIAWIDRHAKRRLPFLFHRPIIYIPELLCLMSGLAMPLLEFIPFSASIVATGVAFLALSMMTRDGLFFILAMVPYGGLAALLVAQLT